MKNPVILVHGINDDAAKMRHIGKALRDSGWHVFSVSLQPSNGQIGIDELAQQLKDFINQNVSDHTCIDLIGFSMGGLICRFYIQRLNGLSKVKHFISISSPHHGTWIAYLLSSKGAKQMRYNSDFILDLNKDVENLKSIKFTSIWTSFDLMIIPSSSSHVEIGKEIKIFCLVHPLMLRNKKCIRSIQKELLSNE